MSRSVGRTWMWRGLAIGYAAALSVATHWPRLQVGPNDLGAGLQRDKLMHFAACGALAALAWWARPAGRERAAWVNAWTVLIGVTAWAALDEWTQRWFEREPSWPDLLASWCGVWAAVLVVGPRVDEGWRRLAGATRAGLLVLGPTVALFAMLPAGNQQAIELYRWAGLPVHGTDKPLHAVAGGLWAWWLGAMALVGVTRPRASAAAAVVLALLAQPVLELVQHATGRGWRPDPGDVAWHLAGTSIGLGAWAVLRSARVTVAGLAASREAA